jgi:hypothetical protein
LNGPYLPLDQIFKSAFPEHNWEFSNTKFHKKSQNLLKKWLLELFPKEELLEEYRHPDMVVSGRNLELDLYYPKLSLAFEYQVSSLNYDFS